MGLLLKLRDEQVPLPAAAALFSPLTDFTLAGPSMRENARRDAMFWPEGFPVSAGLYLGAASPETPYASPLFGDPAGLPPLLIHTGETELLRDDSTRLAAKAQAAGVRVELKLWPVVPHVWQLLHSFIPEARTSLAEATAFLMGATGS
jgi:monoterpene epsilon-lactone hydrolase